MPADHREDPPLRPELARLIEQHQVQLEPVRVPSLAELRRMYQEARGERC